ncbi:MAG: GDSL-type esterase/lipase family protein [Candidatus Izemoplasmatales bacterium]|jgi:lysophospholipase L1-like esterase
MWEIIITAAIKWEIIITAAIMSVLAAIACKTIYDYAKKKGMKDLLKLFMKSGFDSKVASFSELNRHVKKGGILFLGDSITQDYPIHDFFPGLHLYNRGIGGDTTEGLLKRLDVSVFELEPKSIILLIGTNDLSQLQDGVEMSAKRLQMAVDQIHERLPETRIYLLAVYPVNPNVHRVSVGERDNGKIQALNRHLKDISGVTYIDLTPLLQDASGNLDPSCTPDGLHLNEKGYRIVTEALKHHITDLHPDRV